MNVIPVITPKAARARLLKLLGECESFSWASAWVTSSDVFQAAISARKKMSHFVIGTHRYITSADCLDECLSIPNVRIVPPTGPMFHPKLYFFQLRDRIEIYVGSSNLTEAGLSHNTECGVFLQAELDDKQLHHFLGFIRQEWSAAKRLDVDFITSYRANQRRVKEAQEALEQFIKLEKPKLTSRSANNIAPQSMSWNKFVALVRKDKNHGLEKRLEVLSQARSLFAKHSLFADLAEIDQKCLAGILRPSIRNKIDWGYFGQMSAYGRYSTILRKHAKHFSNALDHIPFFGNVKRGHFDAYLATFRSIPGASESWIGMGTRLLAMKRPDYFVCIDSANRDGLCNHFGSAPTTTNLDNYWDRIIAPMMLTPWWQSALPENNDERNIWYGRAAMLDAIYYDPKKR